LSGWRPSNFDGLFGPGRGVGQNVGPGLGQHRRPVVGRGVQDVDGDDGPAARGCAVTAEGDGLGPADGHDFFAGAAAEGDLADGAAVRFLKWR
jgi:hypothetical protein